MGQLDLMGFRFIANIIQNSKNFTHLTYFNLLKLRLLYYLHYII